MLNTAAILGRLVADPELKHTPNDIAVTTFTIAVDRSYAPVGDQRQTDFINIVAWRHTAEFICKYFTKGQLIALSGSIQTRRYEDKQGSKRRAFEIVANNVSFADSKRDNSSAPAGQKPTAYNEPPPAYSGEDNMDFEEILGDEDFPF